MGYEEVKSKHKKNLGFMKKGRNWIWRRERKLTTMSLKRLASLGGREAPIVVVVSEWVSELGGANSERKTMRIIMKWIELNWIELERFWIAFLLYKLQKETAASVQPYLSTLLNSNPMERNLQTSSSKSLILLFYVYFSFLFFL